MMLISFRSRLSGVDGKGYDAMAEEMEKLARSHDGFVDVKAYTADDGERLTLVWWRDRESLRAWAENLRHREAQRQGRDRWYAFYKLEVAEVVRTADFHRD
jgi:heme-degrading monooxygenase HmoA